MVAPEGLALFRNVDPEAAMSADARRAFDGEANRHRVARLGRNVDVLARDLGRAIVVEGQQVDLVGNHCFGGHGEGEKSELPWGGARAVYSGRFQAGWARIPPDDAKRPNWVATGP